MIDARHFRVVCAMCDGDFDITYEDVYGDQYKLTHCIFCGSDDIEIEEETPDENF